jgi:hypothetical protein
MKRPTTAANGDLDAIKSRSLDIYRRYVNLKPQRRRYVGRCPLHSDKTPSFNVFEDGGHKCFGCGVGGDVLDFVMRIEHVDFPEAKRIAADITGVSLSRVNPRQAAPTLQARKLAAELVEWRDALIQWELIPVRNTAWAEAGQIDRATIGADPDDPQVWELIAQAVERRKAGDVIEKYIDAIKSVGATELAELRTRLEGAEERRAA